MINTAYINRAVRKGDTISGMTVTFTDGFVWSGEFHATYGDGKVAAFLAQCDQDKVGMAVLNVTSDATPTTAYTYAHTAYQQDR